MKQPHMLSTLRRSPMIGAALALILFGSGCATASGKKAEDASMLVLKSRIEEVERTNGRLTVRMEEMEDQLFLLNDRVESHRIALQRRAGDARLASRAPQAPGRAPESSYYPDDEQIIHPRALRPIKRIPLPQRTAQAPAYPQEPTYGDGARLADSHDEGEIVISDEEYRAWSGETRQRPTQTESSTQQGGRRAQPSVTAEKLLPQGASSEKTAAPSAATTSASPPASTGLRLYKDSLAAYRGGEYAKALAGFEAFLASGPKRDYLDNALYWIGECHYGLGDFTRAVLFFERVLSEQPDGNKVPDAMLKMSYALEQMGQGERSQEVLSSLTQRYPMTNAAQLGQKKLAGNQ